MGDILWIAAILSLADLALLLIGLLGADEGASA